MKLFPANGDIALTYEIRINPLISFLSTGFIRFEECELDRARWQMSWRGEPIPLQSEAPTKFLTQAEALERLLQT